jgi:hypothetical protein
MTALDTGWPMTLQGRAYVGRRGLNGGWRVVVDDELILAPDARRLARALLRDAFDGHRVREDLVDAFAAWLPRCDFRISAEFVAAWGLRWALARDE